jgi:hypothetical protein
MEFWTRSFDIWDGHFSLMFTALASSARQLSSLDIISKQIIAQWFLMHLIPPHGPPNLQLAGGAGLQISLIFLFNMCWLANRPANQFRAIDEKGPWAHCLPDRIGLISQALDRLLKLYVGTSNHPVLDNLELWTPTETESTLSMVSSSNLPLERCSYVFYQCRLTVIRGRSHNSPQRLIRRVKRPLHDPVTADHLALLRLFRTLVEITICFLSIYCRFVLSSAFFQLAIPLEPTLIKLNLAQDVIWIG